MTKLQLNILSILLPLLLISCSKKNFSSSSSLKSNKEPEYSNLYYWAAHPWKWDPSDSIPLPLLNQNHKDSVADVFFIHPTTLTDFSDSSWNASMDDSILNNRTDNSTILYQASVFNEQCRIFAPRYRQAHLKVFYDKDTLKDVKALDMAYSDVRSAFLYYLDHFNKGRPVIIASHSQGTLHAGKLLKEFFEGKILQNKLICAYLIGMPVPENYFTELQPCKDSLQTGCFVSWRTFKKNYYDTTFVAKEQFKCIVTNPLTWTNGNEYAPSSLNTGGVLTNFNRIKYAVTDAQVHKNVLWTCKPRFFGNILLRTKNYHIGDINLFYTNIRTNVRTRIRMFWKK